MKLFFCPHCNDIQKMQDEKRTCLCGGSWAHYINEVDAVIGGFAIPLGIGNTSFSLSVHLHNLGHNLPHEAMKFEAWIITMPCSSITKS
jgi:hypothetical protein